MWTCSKCLYDNSDRVINCESCGAPRNNRRFSAPAVQPAAYDHPTYNRDVPPQRQNMRSHRPVDPLPPPRSMACRLLRLCGALLTLLLPLLCILLCWKQYDVLYTALVPLLRGNADHNTAGTLCYLLYCSCAVLLCLTPGLSMLTATGKYKKKKRKEDSKLL